MLYPTAWKVYGRMSLEDAGRARVVLWVLFQEAGFIPGSMLYQRLLSGARQVPRFLACY